MPRRDFQSIRDGHTANELRNLIVANCDCEACARWERAIQAHNDGMAWLQQYDRRIVAHYVERLNEYGGLETEWENLDLHIHTVEIEDYLPYIVLFQYGGSLFYTTFISENIIDRLRENETPGISYGLWSFSPPVSHEVGVTGICDVCGQQMLPGYKLGKYKVHRTCVRQHGYHTGNTLWVGERVNLPSFSIEFEMHRENRYRADEGYDNAIVELIKHGFRRTTDGTVSDEMVSPIYRSNAAFLLSLPTMQAAKDYVDSDCGSHIHTGMTAYPRRYLQEHTEGLLQPLLNYLIETEDMFPLLWGRGFCSFADSDFGGRYSFINVSTGYDTIEYRLPKFCSDRQYRYLVQFVRLFSKEYTRLYNAHLRTSCTERLTPYHVGTKLLSFYRKFEAWAMPRLERM